MATTALDPSNLPNPRGHARYWVDYELRDGLNQPIAMLPVDQLTGGVIDTDPDRDIVSTLTVDVQNAIGLVAYANFIAPLVTIETDDGATFHTQAGLYQFEQGSIELSHRRGQGFIPAGSHTLSDLSGRARAQQFGRTYPVASNALYMASARTMLDLVTLPNGQKFRFDLPPVTTRLPKARDFKPDQSVLAGAAELTSAIGHYTPWPTRKGLWRTRAYRDPQREAPDRTFVVGEGGDILPPIQIDPAGTKPVNQLTVVQEDEDAAKRFRAVAELAPSSPFYKGGPAGLLPRTEVVSQYANQAAVSAYALRLMTSSLSATVNATIVTRLIPWLEPHELYLLDLSAGAVDGDASDLGNGVWKCGGFRHELDAAKTTHRLTRSDQYQLTYEGV